MCMVVNEGVGKANCVESTHGSRETMKKRLYFAWVVLGNQKYSITQLRNEVLIDFVNAARGFKG